MSQSYTILEPSSEIAQLYFKEIKEENYFVKIGEREKSLITQVFSTRGFSPRKVDMRYYFMTNWTNEVSPKIYRLFAIEYQVDPDESVEGQFILSNVLKTKDDFYWINVDFFNRILGTKANPALTETMLVRCDQLRGIKDFVKNEL